MNAHEYLRTWMLLVFSVNTLTVISFFWAEMWDRAPGAAQGPHPPAKVETGIVPCLTVVGIVDWSFRTGIGTGHAAGLRLRGERRGVARKATSPRLGGNR